jgi:ABC-2 type transport system permease protein
MNEIGIVFAAEFGRKIRSRIFMLATLGGAVMIAFLVEAPSLFSHVTFASTGDIVLAGPAALRARAEPLLEAHQAFRVVASLETLPQPVTVAFLDAHGKAAAAVALSVSNHQLHLDVYPRDLAAYDEIEFRALLPLSLELATGLSSAQVVPALRIPKTIHPIDRKFIDAKSATFAHGVAFGLIFILYFAIIIASQSVMASVAEEKTSRIAEVLVATISPVNLLTAKTLAAAALALVQIGVWVVTALLLLPHAAAGLGAAPPGAPGTPGAASADGASQLLAFDPGELLAFALFFVLGYLQYATIYAAAASLISRTEDLGTVTTPVIMPVVAAFFVAQYAILQPGAPLAVAFSFVPFISPFVIFSRIAVSIVPWWQIALAVAINLATVAVAFYAAGKVYRVGMLLYGKAPTLRQVWAALRA